MDFEGVGQWLIEHNLPLTCLEFYFETQDVHNYKMTPALAFATSCAAASCSVPVVMEEWIPLLIVDFLRQKNEKLAAITVEEAFSESVRMARQTATCRPSLTDVVRLSRIVPASERDQPAREEESSSVALKSQLAAAGLEIESLRRQVQELVSKQNQRLELPTQSGSLAVVQELAERLPTLISAVETEKKDALVPVITRVIEHHPSASTRASLVYSLLNLYRKPTADQRVTLAEGLFLMSQRIDAQRVEQEVVPELWGLLSHRYYEKRTLLVACVLKLAPLVSTQTRSAFVSNILVPLSVDPSSTVRSLTAAALAVVWTEFESKELREAVELLVVLYLDDKKVVQDAVEKTFPAVVRRCLDAPESISLLIVTILSALEKMSPRESAYEPSVAAAAAPEKTLVLLGALRKVFCFVRGDDASPACNVADRSRQLFELFRTTVFATCIQLLGSPGFASRDRFVHELAAVMSSVTLFFGVAMFAVVGDLFAEAIRRAQNNDEATARQALLTAMVVHFCCVVPDRKSSLPSSSDPQAPFLLSASVELLVNCFVDLASHGQNDVDVFALSLQVVCKKYTSGILTVVNVLWRAVEHTSPFLRKLTVGLVLQCGGAGSEEALVRYFWPQLLVLINDKVEDVQHTAVRAAFSLSAMPVASSPATQEKMFSTLFAAVESTSVSSQMTMLYLSQWRDNMKSVPSEPRETYLYPQLTCMCRQVLEVKGKEPTEVINRMLKLLLDVFWAISTCAVVSPQLVKSQLSPALKLLGKDLEASSDKSSYQALLKDYAQIEHRLKPQVEPRSFFDKVKDEIKKHV